MVIMMPQDAKKQSYAKTLKGKSGAKRIFNAMRYSKDGFIAAYKNEAAFRQLVWLHSILVVLIIFMPFVLVIKMILVILSFLSIIVELFNTGLEAVVDRISDEYHPLAKVAKDVGSTAQLIMLILIFVIWIMAFYSLTR